VCVLFGPYFLLTEIEIAITGCHILMLKGTKIDFVPDHAGALTALPRPKVDLSGRTSKGGEGKYAKGKGEEKGGEGT